MNEKNPTAALEAIAAGGSAKLVLAAQGFASDEEFARMVLELMKPQPLVPHKPDDVPPLCGAHAESWFCERNLLKGDLSCIVCAFDSMKWTTKLPEMDGWYWYRPNKQSKENFRGSPGKYGTYPPYAITNNVTTIFRVRPDTRKGMVIETGGGTRHTVSAMAGEWCGPLLSPTPAVVTGAPA